ncbi:hypothetical protein Taro_032529 [Colocasia esculenta]|uniref:Uncharacterized protein n=1 Tax=Colocasia esculenta TaxID=4460 RepID=A0A843VRK7_COLES|nr:hypothetical protein [Colocasia esculenta]
MGSMPADEELPDVQDDGTQGEKHDNPPDCDAGDGETASSSYFDDGGQQPQATEARKNGKEVASGVPLLADTPFERQLPNGWGGLLSEFRVCNACRSEKLASTSLDAGLSVGVHRVDADTTSTSTDIDANLAYGQNSKTCRNHAHHVDSSPRFQKGRSTLAHGRSTLDPVSNRPVLQKWDSRSTLVQGRSTHSENSVT